MSEFDDVPLHGGNKKQKIEALTILDRYVDALNDDSIDDYNIRILRDVVRGEKPLLSGQSMKSVEQFLRSSRKALAKRGVTEDQFKGMYQRFIEQFQKAERKALEERLFSG